jgi:hypothetical protein
VYAQGGRSKGRASVLRITLVPRNAMPCVRQMAPRPGVTSVRLMGQFVGTEKRSPAKLAECHDNGTTGAGPETSTTARGETASVSITRAPGPSLAPTSTCRVLLGFLWVI